MHPSATEGKQSFSWGSSPDSFSFRFGCRVFLLCRRTFLRCRRRRLRFRSRRFHISMRGSRMNRGCCCVRTILPSSRLATHMRNRCKLDRLCDSKRTPRLHDVRRQMIPTPQLLHRHSKAIGDCNQRIAATHSISLRTRVRHSARNWNHQLISGVYTITQAKSVSRGNVARVNMRSCCDVLKRLTIAHNMKAPTGTLGFRNLFDPFHKDVACADRNMQIKRHVTRGCHPQQTWIQSNNLRKR